MRLSGWTSDQLAQRCQQQIVRFRHRLASDTRYCFELFRRAFQVGDEAAQAAIHRLYNGLVYYWVRRHPANSEALNVPDDYLAADSISQFFLGVQKRGFENFSSLEKLLAFWRRCVHSVIMTAARKRQVPLVDEAAPVVRVYDNPDSRLDLARIWGHVESLLPDQDDRRLARLMLVLDLPPRDVVALHPDQWPDAQAVRVARQRIMRRLRGDATLRRLLGLPEAIEAEARDV